jgi:uncharacterized membrane protein
MAGVLAQQFRHVVVVMSHRIEQRCAAVISSGINLGFVGEQQFRNILKALTRSFLMARFVTLFRCSI